MLSVEIGERLKQLRAGYESKMSQSQLSKRMQVSRETINHWENGTREIKASQVTELADIFDVSCDYILKGVSPVNVDINRQVGLNDKAINKLYEIIDETLILHDRNYRTIDILNYILSSGVFTHELPKLLLTYFDKRGEYELNLNYDEEENLALVMFKITRLVQKLTEDSFDSFYMSYGRSGKKRKKPFIRPKADKIEEE